jgi:hypothetical protein
VVDAARAEAVDEHRSHALQRDPLEPCSSDGAARPEGSVAQGDACGVRGERVRMFDASPVTSGPAPGPRTAGRRTGESDEPIDTTRYVIGAAGG